MTESVCVVFSAPAGYSEISSIPINKPTRRLYNVRGPHAREVVSVLLQVDAKQGNKVITVRSPLQVNLFQSLNPNPRLSLSDLLDKSNETLGHFSPSPSRAV